MSNLSWPSGLGPSAVVSLVKGFLWATWEHHWSGWYAPPPISSFTAGLELTDAGAGTQLAKSELPLQLPTR